MPTGAIFHIRKLPGSDFQFGHVSEGISELVGVEASEVLADSGRLFSRIPPEDLDRFRENLTASDGSSRAVDIDLRILGPGGEIRWAVVRAEVQGHSSGIDCRGIFFDVTDRKRAELLLTAENRLSGLLSEFPDEPRLWPALLPLVADESQWDVAECWRRTGESDLLHRTAVWTRPGVGVDRFAAESAGWTFPAGDGLPGIAWRAGDPVWIPDLRQDTTFRRKDLALSVGLRCGVGVPIRVGGECVGVIALFARPVGQDFPAMRTFARTLGRTLSRFLEHQHAEAAVREARDAAERANRAKDRFLATVSHELRTPLAGILGTVDLGLSDTTVEAFHDRLDTIRDSAGSLLGLVNDLLDFAKVRAGRLDLHPVPLDIRTEIHRWLRTLAERARGKGLDFSVSIADEVPRSVLGDSTRLRQILVNLVGNAVKFTERGQIRLRVDTLPVSKSGKDGSHRIRFRIRDTGVGIPTEKLRAIFRPFEQVDDSPERRFGGTGLGLAIADRLVRLMRGKIQVRSVPQEGSEFRFAVELPETISKSEVSAPPPIRLPSMRILLAEDDPILREVTAEILRRAGHQVTTVRDGEEAISAAIRHFDVILLDIQMPGTGGESAAFAIRRSDLARGRRVPILAFSASHPSPTASGGGDVRAGGYASEIANFDGFVQKPADTHTLLSAIGRVLGFGGDSNPPVPVLDPTGELLSRTGGDREVLAALAPRVAEEVSNLVRTLRTELEAGEIHTVARIAHRLIGLVGLLSGVGCHAARRLETSAAAGQPRERLEAEIEVLERVAAGLPGELQKWVDSSR